MITKSPSKNIFRTISNIYGAFSIELLVKTVTSFIIYIYNAPKQGSFYVSKSDLNYKWMEYCNKVVCKNRWQEIWDNFRHCYYRYVNCLDSFACVKEEESHFTDWLELSTKLKSLLKLWIYSFILLTLSLRNNVLVGEWRSVKEFIYVLIVTIALLNI